MAHHRHGHHFAERLGVFILVIVRQREAPGVVVDDADAAHREILDVGDGLSDKSEVIHD